MGSWPLTRSDPGRLPASCRMLGSHRGGVNLDHQLKWWQKPALKADLLLLLAATKTAEHPGISAAGCTAASRRLTALADAELLQRGPAVRRRWSLPALPAGVSPALISHVVVKRLGLNPLVAAIGLPLSPDFMHMRLEPPGEGPAACLSDGHAMTRQRVIRLWRQGERLGRRLRRPLVLAECVPGGTTTAQAVLSALGLKVSGLVSGSARQPPQALKSSLVEAGLVRAALGSSPSSQAVLAAVGDPFQAVAAGLLVGAARSDQPVLLGGGSQMIAVAALALMALPVQERENLAKRLIIGTTAWLAQEDHHDGAGSMLGRLVDAACEHCGVPLTVLACGVHFDASRHQPLRDYELGFVKEGVGAGALLLFAQLQGASTEELVVGCDRAMDALLAAPVTAPVTSPA